MSKSELAAHQRAGKTTTEAPTIEGPIPEFDHTDAYTGYDYFRCSGCGIEAMRARDVRAECECGNPEVDPANQSNAVAERDR